MSNTKTGQASLFSFGFNKNSSQSEATAPAPMATQAIKTPSNPPSPTRDLPTETFTGINDSAAVGQPKSSISENQIGEYTSSLSPPCSSIDLSSSNFKRPSPSPTREPPAKRVSLGRSSPLDETLLSSPLAPPPNNPSRDFIKGSDDDDSGSDFGSGLSDLEQLMQTQRSDGSRRSQTHGLPSQAPTKSTRSRNAKVHTSPLAVLPKRAYKFNLKELTDYAREEDNTEVISRLRQPSRSPEISALPDFTNRSNMPSQDNLLDSVATDGEGGSHRIKRALKRTEATLAELRFRFFDTSSAKSSKPERLSFPRKGVKKWGIDLRDPRTRHQTFVSGFAEDMVKLNQTLPDEIFLWLISEMPKESDNVLRTSYCNTLRESHEQIGRLFGPELIRTMFQSLGGSSTAIDVTKRISAVQELAYPCGKRSWAKTRSVIRFLGLVSRSLEMDARIYVVIMLLRVSCDYAAFDELEIFDMIQEAFFRICRYVPDDMWDSFCTDIGQSLFAHSNQPTLQLQMVRNIPSTLPRTHDLRRRLAMSFYFKNTSYSAKHSFYTMNLKNFITRLHSQDFYVNDKTDFRELGSLVSLMDIGLDDGRSVDVDLTQELVAREFDFEVQDICDTLDDIVKNMHGPQGASISKIHAKEVLQAVSQRISDTVRSRPKAKRSIFDSAPARKELVEDLSRERKGMSLFLKPRPSGFD